MRKVDLSVLKRLERALTPSSVKIPLVPNRPARGRLMKRWGVVING
jgi:predicted transcriptional regulator of viral defense system